MMASYVASAIQPKFETLSINLKNAILERNVRINTIHDLIHVLEDIVAEAEAEEAADKRESVMAKR